MGMNRELLIDMRIKLFLQIIILSITLPTFAQNGFHSSYLDNRVASLIITIKGSNSYRPIPYYTPSNGEAIRFDFDLLEYTPATIYYKLEYCDALWRKSSTACSLSQQGFSVGELNEPSPSGATKVKYWHYSLQLSERANPHPQASGNWRIIFFEAGCEGSPLLEARFALLSPEATINTEISNKAQTEAYGNYQQVSATIISMNNTVNGTDLAHGAKVFIYQNGRSDNCQQLNSPSEVSVDGIQFNYASAGQFEAGNEYESFEIISENETNMGIEHLYPLENETRVLLYPTYNRSTKPYQLVHDANGRRVVRAPINQENPATEADYYLVNFRFYSEKLNTPIYISGEEFDCYPTSERELEYNPTERYYTTTLLLKAGYYSYQYVTPQKSSKSFTSSLTAGNHYQTSNNYSVLVYYQGITEECDKLIAATEISNYTP